VAGVANIRLMRGRLCRWARFWQALRGMWRWGLGVLWLGRGRGGLCGVSTGSPSGLGFVGEWESLVRWGVGRMACGLAAVFGLVSGVFGAGGRWFPW
jgi:hypothetical protein